MEPAPIPPSLFVGSFFPFFFRLDSFYFSDLFTATPDVLSCTTTRNSSLQNTISALTDLNVLPRTSRKKYLVFVIIVTREKHYSQESRFLVNVISVLVGRYPYMYIATTTFYLEKELIIGSLKIIILVKLIIFFPSVRKFTGWDSRCSWERAFQSETRDGGII